MYLLKSQTGLKWIKAGSFILTARFCRPLFSAWKVVIAFRDVRFLKLARSLENIGQSLQVALKLASGQHLQHNVGPSSLTF
jgi:hypothetical protein